MHYWASILSKISSLAKFRLFEQRLNSRTKSQYDRLLTWAETCASRSNDLELEKAYAACNDEVVRQGYRLSEESKQYFNGKLKNKSQLRVLIHVPSADRSPGGYSLFSNLAQSLNFIGISAAHLEWHEPIDACLNRFKPSIFITSDTKEYLNKIDWTAVKKYKSANELKVGLTASLEEYGNTCLSDRLRWAKNNSIDFYYSFRPQEYLAERPEYRPFFDNGYSIFSVEFGANPLLYYPVPNIERDIEYVFLASTNYEKRQRYYDYLGDIFELNTGFIDGPGWSFSKTAKFNANRDRYLYSRARVGINLHLPEQIEWACELNERTYMLAACGIPQLIDNPKLLLKRFSPDSMFIAKDKYEYMALFTQILNDTNLAKCRALKAQMEVFEKHTTFHRAEKFAYDMLSLLK